MPSTPSLPAPGADLTTRTAPEGGRGRPYRGRLAALAAFAVAWLWRILVAAVLSMNHLTCLLILGWVQRWAQGRVLLSLWRRSAHPREERFEDFLADLGPGAPALRPRWLLRDRPRVPGASPATIAARLGGLVASLPLSFSLGFQLLFCTWLITGWGCLLMLFSWELGWLNSFHKGYETSAIGPLVGVLGIVLLAAGLLHVPLAQVHHAATRDYRAFFDFRFVWKLLWARPGPVLLLACLFVVLGWLFEAAKSAPLFFPAANLPDDPVLEREGLRTLLRVLQRYYLVMGGLLFLALLLTRRIAASVYASALISLVRAGRLERADLHPALTAWLDRLSLTPAGAPPSLLVAAVKGAIVWPYRVAVGVLLFLIWVLFVIRVYPGEFLNYHPYSGFLNHPLVQLPCFNYIPRSLVQEVKEMDQQGPHSPGDGPGSATGA